MIGSCRCCRNPLLPGSAIEQIWVFAEVRAGQVQVEPEPEAIHADCANPLAPNLHPEVSNAMLKRTIDQPVPARSPAHQCLLCGKVYARGHRFRPIYRARDVQHDPVFNAPNVRAEPDWETAHVRCDDPELRETHNAPLVLA